MTVITQGSQHRVRSYDPEHARCRTARGGGGILLSPVTSSSSRGDEPGGGFSFRSLALPQPQPSPPELTDESCHRLGRAGGRSRGGVLVSASRGLTSPMSAGGSARAWSRPGVLPGPTPSPTGRGGWAGFLRRPIPSAQYVQVSAPGRCTSSLVSTVTDGAAGGSTTSRRLSPKGAGPRSLLARSGPTPSLSPAP